MVVSVKQVWNMQWGLLQNEYWQLPHSHAILYAWFLKDRPPHSPTLPLPHPLSPYLEICQRKLNMVWSYPPTLFLPILPGAYLVPMTAPTSSKGCEFTMTLFSPQTFAFIFFFLLVDQTSSFLLPFQRNPPWLLTLWKKKKPLSYSKHQADSSFKYSL